MENKFGNKYRDLGILKGKLIEKKYLCSIIKISKYGGYINMTYLIAKRFDQSECLAVRMEPGKELAKLVSEMGRKYLDKGIQILTLSNPETFGEYKPYLFIKTLDEFIEKVDNPCL